MTEQALSEAAEGAPVPEADVADAEQDSILDAHVEEHVQGDRDDGDDDASLEAEAREMGWVPESEWKGEKKPRKFYSAKEFVERGETILPIALKRAREAEAKLADVEKKWEERFSRMEKMSQKALERQKEKLIADFDARKREAVKLGDEEGYDAAEKAKEKALKELDEQAAPEKEEPAAQAGALTPAQMAAFTEWHADNQWFKSDEELTDAFDIAFNVVRGRQKTGTFAEHLEAARERVVAMFPDKFGGKTTKRAGAVEGGSRIPATGGGKLSAKLPAEARSAGMKFVSDGLYKDIEEYAKAYFEE